MVKQNKERLIIDLLYKPKIIGLIANVNEGKSNLLYWIIELIKNKYNFSLYVFGLKNEISNAIKIYSVEEMEQIKNSIIILDEVMSLWDLDNRKSKKLIENTLRLINHNNNILIISGVPENFKKFISSKINVIIYKKVTFEDFINGCSVKNRIMNYKGKERGTSILDLDINEALLYDKKHFYKIKVPYIKKYDTKKDNVLIIREKSVPKNVPKNVPKKDINEDIKPSKDLNSCEVLE